MLAMAFLRDFPQHYALFNQRSVTVGKRSRGTVNSILGAYDGADGMKTGFTCASGYNMVASAERDGRRLIGIVLGSRNGGAAHQGHEAAARCRVSPAAPRQRR